MPSLTQLLTNHQRLMVLDAASKRVQAGLFQPGLPGIWRTTEEEAGTGIFACVEALLHESEHQVGDMDAFVFCDGPGSMLGIRTIAMALSSWRVLASRSIYAYQSLAVAGRYEWSRQKPRNFAVIADARRNTWHCQEMTVDGHAKPVHRASATELPAGELVTPEHFRAWSNPPRITGVCSYDLELIFPTLIGGEFFHAVDNPEAFQPEVPDYKKWSAQVHQAVTAEKS